MKKRIIALLTLLVLLVTMSATAMAAAKKPTATLLTKNKTVTAGSTTTFEFKVRSNGYSRKNNAFRAKLVVKVLKDGVAVGNAPASWVWTGNQVYGCQINVPKTAETGKYKLSYTTYYRASAKKAWKKAATKSGTFTVK